MIWLVLLILALAVMVDWCLGNHVTEARAREIVREELDAQRRLHAPARLQRPMYGEG